MSTLIAPFINVLILVGLLVYFLREPVRTFVSQRYETVRDTVKKVRDMLRQAQEQYDEFSAKLKAIDAEVAALHEETRQEALAVQTRISGEAQRMSQVILSDARIASENVYSDLKTSLRVKLATRILERVEELVKDRLTGDDRAKIRQEFSVHVENVQ